PDTPCIARRAPHRDLAPLPTRRSSDLPERRSLHRGRGPAAVLPPLLAGGGWGGVALVRQFGGPPRSPIMAVHLSHGHRMSFAPRSEEHTSELQSRENLVCRLLLEKQKT